MYVKMKLSPSQSRQRPSNSSRLPTFVPNELITVVLSRLPVKSFMRMRCVSKPCNSLFTDSNFVKLHFIQSARNPHLALVTKNTKSVVPVPVCDLLDNSLITIDEDPCYLTHENIHPINDKVIREIVGSCNGLICILSYSIVSQDLWLHFWNPSTRKISKKIGHIFRLFRGRSYKARSIKFTFGYDSSSDNYRVLAIKFNGYNVRTIEAKIFSLGENAWRNVEIFPAVPLQLISYDYQVKGGVCLSGTFNWLSVFDFNVLDVEQYVIISLNLGTNTWTQMRLPPGFDKNSVYVCPTISVLMGYLCFSYNFNQTHIVIKESWTQFLRISYQHLQSVFNHRYNRRLYTALLVPLYLSDDGHRLILASNLDDQAIIYKR